MCGISCSCRCQWLQIRLVSVLFFFFPLLPLVFPKCYSSGRVYVLQLFQLLSTVVRLDPGGMVEWKERGRTLYNLMIKSHSFSGPVWDMYDLYKCFSSVIASPPPPTPFLGCSVSNPFEILSPVDCVLFFPFS